MSIIIVGRKGNQRQVQWFNFFAMVFVLGMMTGLVSGGVYYLLCGIWSHTAVLLGIIIGVGILSAGLITGLRIPIDKLQELK